MNILLDTVMVVLLVDFGSGLLHWLEDSYGRPEWPITGPLVTQPNILHHRSPTAFTGNSWLCSANLLLVIGSVIIAGTWAFGMLTWQVMLFVAIGVNANEIHKWAHLPAVRRFRMVRYLQKLRLLQTPEHHARHHMGSKDSHYCVITNLLNPVLDTLGFWRGFENSIEWLFGLRKRPDSSLRMRAGRVS